jgi:hypothetical protein
MIDAGVIERRDVELFSFADTPEAVWARLVAGGLCVGETARGFAPDLRDRAREQV